jgi:hypothetical protein
MILGTLLYSLMSLHSSDQVSTESTLTYFQSLEINDDTTIKLTSLFLQQPQ